MCWLCYSTWIVGLGLVVIRWNLKLIFRLVIGIGFKLISWHSRSLGRTTRCLAHTNCTQSIHITHFLLYACVDISFMCEYENNKYLIHMVRLKIIASCAVFFSQMLFVIKFSSWTLLQTFLFAQQYTLRLDQSENRGRTRASSVSELGYEVGRQ